MTGASYRWTASFGMFLGGVTTVLMALALLPFHFPDERLAFVVWFTASMAGVGLSLVSLFLHSDHPDLESPLDHRASGYVGVALNVWPWVLLCWMVWFIRLGFF